MGLLSGQGFQGGLLGQILPTQRDKQQSAQVERELMRRRRMMELLRQIGGMPWGF